MAFTIVSMLGNTGKGRHPQALAIQACMTVLGSNRYVLPRQLQKHYIYQKPVS